MNLQDDNHSYNSVYLTLTMVRVVAPSALTYQPHLGYKRKISINRYVLPIPITSAKLTEPMGNLDHYFRLLLII